MYIFIIFWINGRGVWLYYILQFTKIYILSRTFPCPHIFWYTRCMTGFITRGCSAEENIIYTRSVQKVSRILCFFKNYLFIHEYLFCPFKVIPIRYTLVPTFFPILEALQKIIFCDLVQLLLRCRLYLLNRRVASSFHGPLQFREQEKVTGGSDLGNTVAAASLVRCFWSCVSRGVIMV